MSSSPKLVTNSRMHALVRALWLTCWLACAVSLPGGAACAQDDPPSALPQPEPQLLRTRDGIQIHAMFYPGTNGNKSVPIILLHGYEGSGAEYTAVAEYLQQQSHAVIVPDLRGHGKSSTVPGRDEPIKASDLKPADFAAMIIGDMEAVKKFLLAQHNEGNLNIEKLCVVGAGVGGIIALNWSVADWSAPVLVTGKQGQDVKAVVLISPLYSFKGLKINDAMTALSKTELHEGLSFFVINGTGNSKQSVKDSKRLQNALERIYPDYSKMTQEQVAERKAIFFHQVDAELEGTQLFDAEDPDLLPYLKQFIDLRLVRKDYPWKKRPNPFGGDE